MAWFLVKCEYVLEDGSVYSRRGWFEGKDFIDACEKARRDRQWDLRQEERVEFEIPQKVVSAKNSARRYNVRPKEIIAFDVTRDGRHNIQYASSEQIRRVPLSEQREGFGGIA